MGTSIVAWLSLVFMLLLVIILANRADLRETAKISRLEDMVKALLDNAGIDFEPSDP